MRIFIFVLAAFLAASPEAIAAPGMPMVKSPLASGEDLATRIETGNGLEAGADFISAFQQVRPELGVSDRASAAAVARDLHLCQPSAGKYIVSRVKNGGTSTRERHVSSSEAALCDDSRNVVVLQKCGNVARPVERLAPPPTPIAVPVACSWCGLANQPLQYAPPLNPATFTEQVKICENGTPCGAAVEVGKALIYGAAGVGAAALLPGTRVTTTVRNTVGGTLGAVSPPLPPSGGGGPVNPPEYPHWQ
jgi:hypothetical protein